MSTYSLHKFLRSPLPIRYLPYALLLFSLIGFLDALYLTIQHYSNSIPPCTIHGCEIVLTSQYATVAGIPIAAVGAGFYLVMMVGAGVVISMKSFVISSETRNLTGKGIPHFVRDDKFVSKIVTLLFILSILGLLTGALLVGLQAFIIHAFCQYCLISALMDFLIFDTCWWLYNSQIQNPKSQ
jgi:uncharacterized membrane protein